MCDGERQSRYNMMLCEDKRANNPYIEDDK